MSHWPWMVSAFPRLSLRTRYFSGLVLFSYVGMHLATLAMGLRSIDAIEAVRPCLMGPWTQGVGPFILLAAAVLHGILGLAAIAGRRTLHLSAGDWAQVILGLLIVPLLLDHLFFVGSAQRIGLFHRAYGFMLATYWEVTPGHALQQVLVVVVVWIHGAIGLHRGLMLKPIWTRVGPWLSPLLFSFPTAALLGFVSAGREALDKLASDERWRDSVHLAVDQVLVADSKLEAARLGVLYGYAALALAAVCILLWRTSRARSGCATIEYDGELEVRARFGLSLLDVSRTNGIPHASVCGGRGRCGTCLVVVGHSPEALTPAREWERQTLRRVHAPDGGRLACQARVCGPRIALARLHPAHADASLARDLVAAGDGGRTGVST